MSLPTITSPHNPRIKSAAKLRKRRSRQRQGRIIIDGLREIARAVEADIPLAEIFYVPEQCGEEVQSLLQQATASGAETLAVTPPLMERLAYGERNEGLVATAPLPLRELAGLALPERPLVAVLEGLEKPGNVGAVLRTADGAGLDAVLVADAGTDVFNPNTIRASLGAVFSLPLAVAPAGEVLAWLRERHFRLLAARVDGAVDYRQADYAAPAALILGSEAGGLSELWQAEDMTALQVPMRGHTDSLNVAATAAVLFYEARRG